MTQRAASTENAPLRERPTSIMLRHAADWMVMVSALRRASIWVAIVLISSGKSCDGVSASVGPPSFSFISSKNLSDL
jgi:hypothetical protein